MRILIYLTVLLTLVASPLLSYAGRPLDPGTTVLPIYQLPKTAAADGKFPEWNGVPAIDSAQFKYMQKNETIAPTDSYAPALRCGMKQGSNDLFFLVTVQDAHLFVGAPRQWLNGDFLEFYLDFGREARDKTVPEWKTQQGKWPVPREMGQYGITPKSVQQPQVVLRVANALNWSYDCATTIIEGGYAYEIRIDGTTVLKDLKLNTLPAYIGIDVAFNNHDYMVQLGTAGWSNTANAYRLFGDGSDYQTPLKYGMLSCTPIAIPAAKTTPIPLPIANFFGTEPPLNTLKKAAATQDNGKLADMVYWAGCQGVTFDTPLVKQLLAKRNPRVREYSLAVLYFTQQPKTVAKMALEIFFANKTLLDNSPYTLTIASMLAEKYAFGYRSELRQIVLANDPTSAFSAIKALAKVGNVDDTAFLAQTREVIFRALPGRLAKQPELLDAMKAAYNRFIDTTLEELRGRTQQVRIPSFTPLREIKAENTDLERHIPSDGNDTYSAQGLLRQWPVEGPKELWRVELGLGKGALVVVNNQAFTNYQIDGKQWGVCLDAQTGAVRWRHLISERDGGGLGPMPSPLVDGDRVYFIPSGGPNDCPVLCLRTVDGTEVWHSGTNFSAMQWSTPLVVGDLLYVPLSTGDFPLIAVDKMTGKIVWKSPACPGGAASPACPVYQIIEGIPQVIFGAGTDQGNEVWGVSATTGAIFWRYPCGTDFGLIPSPTIVGSQVFLCDGGVPFSACLQMYLQGRTIRFKQLYRSESIQTNSYNTVAIWHGAVYGFGNGKLQCSNLSDGKLLWEATGKDWSSEQQLVVADGLIFAITKTGDLVMAEANTSGYVERGRVHLNVELGYPQQPTIANGRIYIRGDQWALCYDLLPTR